ncbi:Period circadian protein [Penicillium daleae]|uniref:Period circadian protein n=1 Tax=Penicillium daleae TaxID=63821 RepID=A0AAD6G560_9EURO|nr:Period circadian protein [Penicillium daleae]KAJ5455920.1 Period circadian protein [Penicillium daleae]
MFFNKSTLALAFVALANLVSAGQTPACLLSVIGASSNPADLATLCGSDMKNIESQIANKCGDNTQSALKFYANTCNAAGHKVDISSVTATSSGFVTATATSGSATGSVGTSPTGSSASGSASGSASTPKATANAAAGLQFQGTALAAAVFVGAAALL